jgi:hypothetical protein
VLEPVEFFFLVAVFGVVEPASDTWVDEDFFFVAVWARPGTGANASPIAMSPSAHFM